VLQLKHRIFIFDTSIMTRTQWRHVCVGGRALSVNHRVTYHNKRDRGESYFERYYRNGSSSPWFRDIKMNRSVFLSINRMRAGNSSLKASLSECNIVSTAECKCGNGLQTEEHIVTKCLKARREESLPRQRREVFPL
jgi:hypothetical protein